MKRRSRILLVFILLSFVFYSCSSGFQLPSSYNSSVFTAANSTTLKPFPENFLWGISTAGHQVEGDNFASQWYVWEQAGKTRHKSGKTVDFLHRYPQDIELAKSLGVNTFRIGIEWSRIEPQKGQVDVNALNFYSSLIKAIRAAGMTPVVTLLHFTYPAWLDKDYNNDGLTSWEDPGTIDLYLKYVELVVKRFGPDVKYWLTFNEPNIWVIGAWLFGATPPGKKNPIATIRVVHNLLQAHSKAYDLIHSLDSDSMVSSNIFHIVFKPFGKNMSMQSEDFYDTDWFMNALETGSLPENPAKYFPANTRLTQVSLLKKFDYVAFDYYYRFYSIKDVTDSGYTPWLGKFYPEGLYDALMNYSKHYPDKPILIAENGMCTENLKPRHDNWTREDHLVKHVYQVQKAFNAGAKIIGYCYWSLVDNFEWGEYDARFGLFSVNVLTDPELKRIPTGAVDVYKKIIANNSVPGFTR